jgi:hypothetical protein
MQLLAGSSWPAFRSVSWPETTPVCMTNQIESPHSSDFPERAYPRAERALWHTNCPCILGMASPPRSFHQSHLLRSDYIAEFLQVFCERGEPTDARYEQRYPCETSNLKSGFALKRDLHFCLQRTGGRCGVSAARVILCSKYREISSKYGDLPRSKVHVLRQMD